MYSLCIGTQQRAGYGTVSVNGNQRANAEIPEKGMSSVGARKNAQAKNKPLIRRTSVHQRKEEKLPSLPKEVISGVEKFVFFVGYPRSGHSIIGSMMDAHPNMIISHEFMLFQKLTQDHFLAKVLQNKTTLFNTLYRKSYKDAQDGWRSSKSTRKGYTLNVGTPWHATFNDSLKVIGDKSGGKTVMTYEGRERQFEAALSSLRNTVKRPIRVIHVVRNPYDMIATGSLFKTRYNSSPQGERLYTLYAKGKVNETTLKVQYKELIAKALLVQTKYIIGLAKSVVKMIHRLNLTVLDIHNADFVRDPKEVISRICSFLDLQCPQDYLQACYDKAYKTPSKSRNLLAWPEDVLTDIAGSMEKIPFFRWYSFEGD